MDKYYRAVFTIKFDRWGGEETYTTKFSSDPCSLPEATLFAQEMKGIVEQYFPIIDVWAPLKDAEVLKRYIK